MKFQWTKKAKFGAKNRHFCWWCSKNDSIPPSRVMNVHQNNFSLLARKFIWTKRQRISTGFCNCIEVYRPKWMKFEVKRSRADVLKSLNILLGSCLCQPKWDVVKFLSFEFFHYFSSGQNLQRKSEIEIWQNFKEAKFYF